jgi:hypothetical protein
LEAEQEVQDAPGQLSEAPLSGQHMCCFQQVYQGGVSEDLLLPSAYVEAVAVGHDQARSEISGTDRCPRRPAWSTMPPKVGQQGSAKGMVCERSDSPSVGDEASSRV